MAPSFFRAIGCAVAVLPALSSADKVYKVSEVYDSTNFFDKFDFISTRDPTGGYVQYQSRAEAEKLGLVAYDGAEMYIGVDHSPESVLDTVKDPGRKSVRLESKTAYNKGLVIAEFSYLPKPTCGSWPAFWFFGEPWPTKGEIDLYENWNDLPFNRHTSHVDAPEVIGECILLQDEMEAVIDSPNCYDFAEGQANFQGCSASQFTTTFGSSNGGVYAMEWTSEHLKIWDWERAFAPRMDMKMVLNLNLCGVAAQEHQWGAACKQSTTYDTCAGYVADKPQDFADTFFKVKDIKFYELVEEQNPVPSTSSAATSASTSSTSTVSTASPTVSASTSSTVPASSTSSVLVVPSSSPTSSTGSQVTTSSQGTAVSSIQTYPTNEQSTDSSSSPSTQTSATTYPPVTTEPPTESTTSTIYSTSVYTITSCAPDVPDCPGRGQVVTEVISVGVTVCPVTKTTSQAGPTTTAQEPKPTMDGQPKPTTGPELPEDYTTSTISETKTYTITECPPSVPDCPVGSVTTEISVTTTVCPVGEKPTAPAENPSTEPTGVPTTPAPGKEIPTEAPSLTKSGPEEEGTTTLDATTTSTSTAIVQVTKTIPRPSSSTHIEEIPTTTTTQIEEMPTATSTQIKEIVPSSTNSEEIVYPTATVVPISSSEVRPVPTEYPSVGFTNSTVPIYPTGVAPPQGTTTVTIPIGAGDDIVQVGAGVRTSASAVLMVIAGQSRPFSQTTRRVFNPNKWHHPHEDPHYKLSQAKPLITTPRMKRFAKSPSTHAVAAAAIAAAFVFYFSNIQTVPVSGRRRFNCFGEDTVAAVADQQAKRIVWEVERQGGRFLGDWDPRTRLVKRVMARLIPVSGMEDAEWEVRVIDDPHTANAFVLPGGKVFVFSGLIPIARNEDGLAAVLGHEIAHNLAEHVAERMSGSIGTNILLGSLVLLTGGLAIIGTWAIGNWILGLLFERPMGRRQESEADYIGLMMMAEACYDPREALQFWKRMERQKQLEPPEWMSTHPSNHNRIQKITEWMPQALEKMQESDCRGTSAFADMFRRALDRGVIITSSGWV
ncbi:hypothetical protein DL764_007282 [Monosporascus ibericus]|uniref:GH16 domain-containing protein n=1 Tax=Monosporascus ibericus TaxID=155417 RepID=A0A4Q4T247_9PEZI|nr:hypothetical protein DL764_007282 [Monosporascus ibericus]